MAWHFLERIVQIGRKDTRTRKDLASGCTGVFTGRQRAREEETKERGHKADL